MTAEAIKKDIDVLFSNSRVPVATTRSDLRDIQEHIEMLLETLPEEDEA